MSQAKVSIIITTRNEQSSIDDCLKSIRKQTYLQEYIEIIVVDNNSTDKTKEIASHYTKNIYNKGPERSAQRNLGVHKAVGEYILYLDADMILAEKVIDECVDKCRCEGFVALYIPEKIIGRGFWIKLRNFERGFYNATCIDAVRFLRRDKFLEIGGFDENLTGPEDWDFDRRLREIGKVSIINSPIYHNEKEFNLLKYINKKSYYAKSFNKYIQKWGRDDSIVIKQLGFRYRYLGVFLEDGKWKRLIAHPLLTLGMYFLRLMIGLNFLTQKKKGQLTENKRGILIISPFFRPNIGGVETHLDDLCEYLRIHEYKVYVLTYQPLTTKAKGLRLEKKENLEIHRVQWLGYNLFPKLESYPIIEFLYLFPGLFIYSFFFLLRHRKEIDAIHAQGLIASLMGKILKLIFRVHSVASVHTVYGLKKKLLLGKVFGWILKSYDRILLVSEKAKEEFLLFGLDQTKSAIFTYWADQEVFRPIDKAQCKKQVGWDNKFVVLFIGRLIKIKGARILVEAARKVDKNIFFAFIVTGTYEDFLKATGQSRLDENIIYVGEVDYSILNLYYTAADILAVPSQYKEGFARVNLEAMLCGTPVIASNRGCLPEIINPDVGELVDPPAADEFAKRIEYYYHHPERLRQLSENCARYARERFSADNAWAIVESYRPWRS